MSGPLGLPHVAQYVFYMKRGRFWASDGVNHAPINPAVLSYLEPVFAATLQEKGRGSLFLAISEDQVGRYGIVTDNNALRASLVDFDRALSTASKTNFTDPENALPPGPKQLAHPGSVPVPPLPGSDRGAGN